MTPVVKFLIGLVAVMGMGWISHGPLGGGEAMLDRIEGDAQAAVSRTQVPVQVRMMRDPMSRVAILSGQADEFQREGQGSLKGVNDIVRETDGVSGIRWATPPAGDETRVMPLLIELLIPLIGAYLIGVGISWFFFGRTRHEGYL